MRSHWFAAVIVVGGASFAFCRLSVAQEPPVPVTDGELAVHESWGANEDRRVVLASVKFREFFGGRLDVAGVPREKLALDPRAPGELASLLAAFRTRQGVLDRKGRSNVRVEGIARDAGGRTIDVLDVQLLPDDVADFSERARAFASDPARRLALAHEALERALRFDEPELRAWARSEAEGALDDRRRALAPGDGGARLELARDYSDVAQVTSKAIAVLDELARDPAVSLAQRERATRVLTRELGAVEHSGHWVSRDELRAALGFVRRRDPQGRDEWVRRERLELELAIAARRGDRSSAALLRAFLGSDYEKAVQDGRLLPGMLKVEVARTRGQGFPVGVDRVVEMAGGSTVTWERWAMPDGGRLFFENGELFVWNH